MVSFKHRNQLSLPTSLPWTVRMRKRLNAKTWAPAIFQGLMCKLFWADCQQTTDIWTSKWSTHIHTTWSQTSALYYLLYTETVLETRGAKHRLVTRPGRNSMQWKYALADVWANLNCVWHHVVYLAEATAMLISRWLCLTPKFTHHQCLCT